MRESWQEIWNASPEEPCAICGSTSLCWTVINWVGGCYNPPTEPTPGWRNLNHQHQKSKASLFVTDEYAERLIERNDDPIDAAEGLTKQARGSKEFFRAQKEALKRAAIPAKATKPAKVEPTQQQKKDNIVSIPQKPKAEADSAQQPSQPREITRPPHIQKRHWEEWIGSGVDSELIALNVESISGRTPYERLLYNWESEKVYPDAVWRQINRRFGDNWGHGGWWGSGVDVLTGGESQWGCFKPDKPRADKSKGFDPNKPKLIKYEHPPKTATEIFALRVPRHIWQKISERFNVPIGSYIYFWEWVKDHPEIPLIISEGAKKAGALLTAGYAAIALPGVGSGYRQPRDEFGRKTGQPYLIPQLQVFAQSGREIYLCFDQDSKQQTVRNVNQAISATAKLLARQGCKVKVVVWHPELGKGADDLIVAHGVEIFDKAFDAALPSEIWGVTQLVKLTYPVDLEFNSRYLGDFAPPPFYQLICLKAPKGTGKTQWLARQVEPLINTGGGKVLLLTHRIQLGEELCNRLSIDYVSELRDSETGGMWGYGLCVDSLHPKSQARFNPDDWEGAYIIIDEAEQVIWHLLNSSTCQSERVAILRCLKQVVQTALSTGGKIFLSDADLSDTAIDYIRALAGFDLRPWTAVNNWKPEQGWQVFNYGGTNPSRLVADLEKQVEQGGKHFVCVSGQRKKSQWGTQILEAHLRAKFSDKKILRIDRESIADPQHPAYGCMAHLNELLPQYDIVVSSPTIETGVSIDCNHFTAVWGIFQGVQVCDSVRQALARVRANVPRYVWIKPVGISRVGNGSTSIKSLLASQHHLTKGNINLLLQADFTDPIDADFQPESLTCWGKKAAVVNLGMGAYRASILKALQDEGHTIIDVEGDEAAAEIVKEEVKEAKEVEYQVHCSAVAAAASTDDKAFQKLKDKRAKTEPERLQQEKGELERRYRVPVTAELVGKNDENWHPKIRLHYFLSQGREHLPAREANVMRNMLGAGEGAIFKPDLNRSMLGTKIALLDWLGFDRLLEQREFSSEDSAILDIAQKAKAHSFEMRAGLGVSVSEKDSPMAIAQRLVGLIGYRFPLLRKEGARGNQIRVYGAAAADFQRDEEGKIIKDSQGQAIPIADGRDEVFAAWERDTAAAATAQQQEMGVEPENVSEFDTVVRGNKYIDISALTTEGVTTEGGDYQATELSPVGKLGIAFQYCEALEDFAAVVENFQATPEHVGDAIALADTAPRRQRLTAWYEANLSEDANFCLASLSKLEAEGAASEDELIALSGELERRGQRCESLLPGDFWQRASSVIGFAADELEQKESRLEAASRLLKAAIGHGADTVRTVLGRWGFVQRWEAVSRLEEKSCEDMQRLMQVAPNWVEWCEV